MRASLNPSFLLLAFLSTLLACTDATGPGTGRDPTAASGDRASANPSPSSRRWRARSGTDREFDSLSAQLPSFAGLSLLPDGSVEALVTRSDDAAAARGLAIAYLARRVRGGGHDAAPAVRVRTVLHSWPDLMQWRDAMLPVVVRHGVHMLDANEVLNRVQAIVTTSSDSAELMTEMRQRGVPTSALHVQVAPPQENLQYNLRQRLRPPYGGMQVTSIEAGNCTLGVSGYRGTSPWFLDDPSPVFITAGHCTAVQGGMTSTVMYQPTTAAADRIGVEIVDPPAFTSAVEPQCPPFDECRWSDAAVVRYDSGTLPNDRPIFGVARPQRFYSQYDEAASLRFYSWDMYTAERAVPLAGTTLRKTGRTTGLTQGNVVAPGTLSNTCVSTRPLGATYRSLCVNVVAGRAGPGDSGSPVYRYLGTLWGGIVDPTSTGNSEFHGILFAGGFDGFAWQYTFAPVVNLERDLGAICVASDVIGGLVC